MNDSLRLYVQKIPKLPTLPVIAQEIISLTNDDSTSIEKIKGTIEKAPPISAKILSFSNSAFYGIRSPITNIKDAIIRIGFNNIKNISLGVSLMTMFQNGKDSHALDYQKIFKHSLAVGMISKLFSDRLDKNISDDVFTGGLLHDLGLLVLNSFFSDTYLKVMDEFTKNISLLDAEKNVLGFIHTEIGEWLAEKWVLPDTITDVILYHHTPSLAKKHMKNISLVHLADIVVTRKFYSATEKEPLYPFDSSILETLGITDDDIKDMESKFDSTIFSDEIFK